jgi:hypothetical protein
VERVELGVRLTALQGLKKGLYTLGVTGASAWQSLAMASSTASSHGGSLHGSISGSGETARGGVVRHVPIADPQLLEEVYQGILQAISDEVLGDHKWDEIMAYS